jgi:hypothetical protein
MAAVGGWGRAASAVAWPESNGHSLPRPPIVLRRRGTKYQYGEAVASNGTVFFARSGQGCGSNVRVVKDPVDGSQKVRFTLHSGIDHSRMHVIWGSSPTAVLFDRYDCSAQQFDVYRFTS